MSKQAFKRLRKTLKLEVSREPLPAYAWPGGYPLYYIVADGEALCPGCVNAEIKLIDAARFDLWDKQWRVIGVDANYEDVSLYCAHCNKQIPAAYAD